uniref:Fibronectin type-III domain-containing protein n=3 Tax=Ciona intestinalis TaxID=7719 RepID=F7AVM0_CIOIN
MLAMRPKATCINIKWKSPLYTGGANVTSYDVRCIPTNEMGSREPSMSYSGKETDALVSNLKPGTKYSFSLRALNCVGAGEWSEWLEVVSSASAPDKPDVPCVVCMDSTTARLSWMNTPDNGSSISGYEINWGSVESSLTSYFTESVTSYTIHGLTPNTLYYFTLQAVNKAGKSVVSDVGQVITPHDVPHMVTNIKVVSVDDAFNISWDEPQNNGSIITLYTLYLKHEDGNEEVINVDVETKEYLVNDFIPDTTYRIKVSARNEIGESPISQPVVYQTNPTRPEPPTLTCVQYSATSLKLNWGEKSNKAVSYLLQIRDKHGRFITIYHGSSCNYRINRLAENTSYKFRINATNKEGPGPFSIEYSFTTTILCPGTMEPPTVNNITSSTCEISWSACDVTKGDDIKYRLCLEDGSTTKVMMYSQCCCLLDYLEPTTKYKVRVAAVRVVSNESMLVGPYSVVTSFQTPSHSSDDTNLLSESPSKQTNCSSHVAAESTEFHINSKPEFVSDERMPVILLAFYVISAIMIAFIAQFAFIE